MGKTQKVKLSFVIPAYNEGKYLGDCLESVLREAERQDWSYEVIVVNNASTDNTKALAKKYRGVRVVDEPHKSLVRARERGLLAARGELLAYLDADSRLSPDWFRILRRVFEDPKIVCLSGPYHYYDLAPVRKSLAELGWWFGAPLTYRLVGYMVLGGNFVAKRDALLKIGGFDTKIAFYGEDTNIAWRLHRVGRVVFRMDFFVHSSGRRLEGAGLLKMYGVYGVNYLWGVLFHRPFHDQYEDIR